MKTKPARSEEPLTPPSPVKQSKNGLLYVCIAVFFFSTSTDKTNAATSFHFLWAGDGAALHFLHHFIAIYNHRPFPGDYLHFSGVRDPLFGTCLARTTTTAQ